MAAPARQDLTITRGDTETVFVTMTTDGSTPIDITSRVYSSQMRTSPDSKVISATATCTITDGPNGELAIVFSASDTSDLSPGYFYWDLQENASGVITTLLSGTVTVLADVTR
jgi:sugar/nucleoside kinase (ribokinase family)